MEVERNLQDAMNVARNVMTEPLLVPGGGAAEMALSQVRLIPGSSEGHQLAILVVIMSLVLVYQDRSFYYHLKM